MPLVVTDANSILDFAAAGLLEDIFHLPQCEFFVPDTLYVEELADHHGVLPGLGLKVQPQSAEAVQYVTELCLRYRGPSINDLFTLALARTLRCMLLSGDASLRAAAAAEGIEVNGALWLIEALLRDGFVPLERVAEACEGIRRDGGRLSWEKVQAQFKHWREV